MKSPPGCLYRACVGVCILRLLAVWYNAPNCSIASLKRGGTAWRIHGAKRSHLSCQLCSWRGFCPARRSTVRHGRAMPKVRPLPQTLPRLRKVRRTLIPSRLRKLRRPPTPPKPPSQRSSQLWLSLRTQRSSQPPRNLQPRRCRSETPSPRQARIIRLLSPRMESFGPGAVTTYFSLDICWALVMITLVRRTSSWTMLRALLSLQIFRLPSKITESFGCGATTGGAWLATRIWDLLMDSLPQRSWTMLSAFRSAICMPPQSSATDRFGRGARIRMASLATGRLTTAATMSQK